MKMDLQIKVDVKLDVAMCISALAAIITALTGLIIAMSRLL